MRHLGVLDHARPHGVSSLLLSKCCLHTCRMATPMMQQTQRNSWPHGKRWRQCRGCYNEFISFEADEWLGVARGRAPVAAAQALATCRVFASSYRVVVVTQRNWPLLPPARMPPVPAVTTAQTSPSHACNVPDLSLKLLLDIPHCHRHDSFALLVSLSSCLRFVLGTDNLPVV